MISEPVLAPEAVGLKVTPKVQVADVAMGAAVQVLVGKAKSPVEETPEIVSGLDPALVKVTVMGALVVFRFWLPKATGLGVAEAAAAATPVPLRGMVRGLADHWT